MQKAERDAEILRRAAAGESERAIARAPGVSRTLVWDVKQAAKAEPEVMANEPSEMRDD